jgi:ProP effector
MNKQRLTAALGLIGVLAERFPAAFAVNPGYRQPLKLGIHLDILAQLSDTIAPRDLSVALRIYVSNVKYLKALVAGAERVDINGTPAGKVTADEAAHARQQLAQQRAKQARRKADSRFPKIDQTLNTNDKPSPRRLGLANLRAAAQARRLCEVEA